MKNVRLAILYNLYITDFQYETFLKNFSGKTVLLRGDFLDFRPFVVFFILHAFLNSESSSPQKLDMARVMGESDLKNKSF